MTTLEQAYSLYRQSLSLLPAESVAIERAIGRVSSETVRAPGDVPYTDRYAMDSYAWFSEALVRESVDRPVALKKGSTLVRPGRRLSSIKLRELMASGLDTIRVARRPQVRVLVVGDAVKERRASTTIGRIGHSSGPMIASMLQRWGYDRPSIVHASIEVRLLAPVLNDGLQHADLVIVNCCDYAEGHHAALIAALEAGVTLAFRGIEHTPAPSTAFGTRGGKALLILPANPAGILVGMGLHARYILDFLEGQVPSGPTWSPGVLAAGLDSSSDMVRFMLMRLFINESGVSRLFQDPNDADAEIDPIALREVIAWVPADEVPPAGSVLYWTELIH